MTKKNRVLILGRPNVGKSTLINRLIGKRKAITSNQAGVTRDIAAYPMQWNDTPLTIIDSGGIFLVDSPDIYLQTVIEDQVKSEIQTASVIVFVVDYQTGIHGQDTTIAHYLRKEATCPCYVAVNKVDDDRHHTDYSQFYQLGFNDPYPISAVHGTGLSDLLTCVTGHLSQKQTEHNGTQVALVGRPNVGKSSLLNAILNDTRVLVDNKAGTTRDAIEVPFQYQGEAFTVVDTAGIKRHARIKSDIEYYATVRSSLAIKESDVVVFLMEVEPFLTDHDKRLINLVIDNAKALIIFVNKWDLATRTDANRRQLEKQAKRSMPMLAYYPFLFGSAQENHHQHKIFALLTQLVERSQQRIKTAQLNTFVERVIMQSQPPSKTGKSLKIFYVTQAETRPPTFIFFVNNKGLLSAGYQRFLEKKLRETFNFSGIPIRLFFKDKAMMRKPST